MQKKLSYSSLILLLCLKFLTHAQNNITIENQTDLPLQLLWWDYHEFVGGDTGKQLGTANLTGERKPQSFSIPDKANSFDLRSSSCSLNCKLIKDSRLPFGIGSKQTPIVRGKNYIVENGGIWRSINPSRSYPFLYLYLNIK